MALDIRIAGRYRQQWGAVRQALLPWLQQCGHTSSLLWHACRASHSRLSDRRCPCDKARGKGGGLGSWKTREGDLEDGLGTRQAVAPIPPACALHPVAVCYGCVLQVEAPTAAMQLYVLRTLAEASMALASSTSEKYSKVVLFRVRWLLVCGLLSYPCWLSKHRARQRGFCRGGWQFY